MKLLKKENFYIDNWGDTIYIDINTVTIVEMSVEEFEKMYEAIR
jgi:hypothetical protein